MANNKEYFLAKLIAEIDKNGNISFDKEITKNLYSEGVNKISMEIFPLQEYNNENVNMKLFDSIKNIQGLPDNIVYNLLKTKGSLKA